MNKLFKKEKSKLALIDQGLVIDGQVRIIECRNRLTFQHLWSPELDTLLASMQLKLMNEKQAKPSKGDQKKKGGEQQVHVAMSTSS
jgi:hypothetical protein